MILTIIIKFQKNNVSNDIVIRDVLIPKFSLILIPILQYLTDTNTDTPIFD